MMPFTSTMPLPEPDGGKYFALCSMAFRQRLREPAVLLANAIHYVLFLCVFAQLYRVLLSGQPRGAHGPRDYLWYIAITEWILCALPRFHLDIEQDVRIGDVAYQLTRPTSYLGFRLSIAAAEFCANLVLLAVVGVLAACALVGPPADPGALFAALPLALLACLLWMLCTAAIGLSAFWLQDTAPLFWIFQKSVFVLGGLWVPLQFYPDWLRTLALALPFSAMLYTPAQVVFGADAEDWALSLGRLCVWCAAAGLLLRFVHARALRALDLHGG
jgi:ABC-2 type transport system permease protein